MADDGAASAEQCSLRDETLDPNPRCWRRQIIGVNVGTDRDDGVDIIGGAEHVHRLHESSEQIAGLEVEHGAERDVHERPTGRSAGVGPVFVEDGRANEAHRCGHACIGAAQ